MRGEQHEEDYAPEDMECPSCGDPYMCKVRGSFDSPREMVGVSEDAVLHSSDGATFVHNGN